MCFQQWTATLREQQWTATLREEQWTATLELKKGGVNIILLQSGITSQKTKVQVTSYKFLFRYHFWCLWPRKSNKNIAFVVKEKKISLEKPRGVSW